MLKRSDSKNTCTSESLDAGESYQSIFNCLPVPVFVLDRKHLQVLECNDSVKRVYGYEKQELLNTSFLNLFEESEHQNYALELRNSETLNHVPQITRDGRTIFVNILVSQHQWMGRPALLVTSSDVIRMLMIREQLIQASKMATLGEMATGIAHELNQPLSVVRTASSFLLNRVRKGESVREDILIAMLEEIDLHLDHASEIINHIREFGRKAEAKAEPVQVNEPMQRALAIFTQQFRLREIQVVKELSDDLPPILADRNRLQQVFINLLTNARDAIKEKRERLGIQGVLQQILVRTAIIDGKVRVEVQDTGIGIPKALRDRIFEPFFTTKRLGKGTGLGLSISYGIVGDYHGTMSVETEENVGSTFTIEFPIQGHSND
jgi:histidine kinase